MKNEAICENHLYQKAYRKGHRAVGKYTAVYALRDYSAQKIAKADPRRGLRNRLGLTVGKKLGSAVKRSRAKRLIREAYRMLECEGNVSHGFLLVIAARGAILNASCNDVLLDLRRSLTSVGLLPAAKAIQSKTPNNDSTAHNNTKADNSSANLPLPDPAEKVTK